MAGYNGVAWFEIGTDDPAGAEKFYGDVFGWTVGHGDGDPEGFQMVTAGDGPGLHAGGLFETGGKLPRYAVFGVLVENVAEACQRVKAAGGRLAPYGASRISGSGCQICHCGGDFG
jgi:hypothetical protein